MLWFFIVRFFVMRNFVLRRLFAVRFRSFSSIGQENLHARHNIVRVRQMGVHLLQLVKRNPVLTGNLPKRVTFHNNMDIHSVKSPFHPLIL